MRRLSLVVIALVLFVSGSAAAQEPLTIYSSLPMQGDFGPQTRSMVNAMTLALEDVGGQVSGIPIKFVPLDDSTRAAGRWEPSRVSRNARTAASDPSTIAYLGEFNSGASAISIPLLNEAGILQISPSNTYVGLTRASGYPGEPGLYYPSGRRTYGRVIPADHLQAAAIVKWMRDTKVKRLFLADDGEVYGGGMAELVKRGAQRAGIKITGHVRGRYGRGRLILSARQVARGVKRTKAHAFFYGGITQNRAVGLYDAVAGAHRRALLFGPDGVAESAFTERVRRSTRPRLRITNPTLAPELYPASGRDVLRRLKERFKREPEPYAIYGYEAMRLALDCIARAGAAARDRNAVIDQFFATKDRDSILGRYSIDANGDTTLPLYGGNVVSRGGALLFDRTINSAAG